MYEKGVIKKLHRAVEHIEKLHADVTNLEATGGGSSGGGSDSGGSSEPTSPFIGKTGGAVGDSITADGSYVNPLRNKLQMASLGIHAAGGTGHVGGGMEAQVAAMPTSYSLIVIAGGVNDFRLNNPLGSIDDCFVDSSKTDDQISSSTFYGAIYRTVRTAVNRFPNGKVIVVTPYNNPETTYGAYYPKWNKKNTQGKTLFHYAQAMREVASLFGIPVADVNAESGINEATDKKYLVDGIHCNATGGDLMAEVIYHKICNTPYFRHQ